MVRRLRLNSYSLSFWEIMLAVAAMGIGLSLARIPLLWAGVGLLILILSILTLIDPLFGVGAMLFFGPSKPLTDYFVPQLPLDIGQIALILTLGSWLLHSFRRRKITLPRSPLNLPLLIFIAAASLSLLNALSVGYALKELIKWGQLLLTMWLIIDLDGKRRWKFVVGMLLFAGLAQALIGIWQFGIRGDGPEHFQILDGRFYRAYGTFEQPNPYAGFIGLTLPLILGLLFATLEEWIKPLIDTAKNRPVKIRQMIDSALSPKLMWLGLFAVLAGISGMALIMSWSRGAWLGFGAALLVMGFALPRKTWIGLVLVVVGGAVGVLALELNLLPASLASRLTGFIEFIGVFDVRGVDINSANFSVIERLAHWQTAQEMARYHPLIGVGFGNYEPVYPAYALLNWDLPLGHAHNIYLNLLAEIGILGLGAYLLFWGSVIWQTWRLTRRAIDPIQRGIALGLLGVWTHLSVHQLLDKLYVANLHLHIGAMLAILSILLYLNRETLNLGPNTSTI